MKKHCLLIAAMLSLGLANAQTDMTGKITNPSFEVNKFEGWVNEGMSCQTNSVFKKKDGNVYVEKWTGRGGTVGNASLKQTLKLLPAGTYTVTASAQNIQEDTPTAVQSGVSLVANASTTAISVLNDYTVTTTVVDGTLALGLELKSATGNYVCVDNFRLTLEEPVAETYATIHQAMQELLDKAASVNQNTGTAEQAELDEACQAVKILKGKDTTDGVTEAMVRLQEAIYDYSLSVASPDAPVDMTNLILNPSFEKNGAAEWVNSGMAAQGNSAFSKKQGNTYMEAWTGNGNSIWDCTLSQVVNLPNGKYLLTAAAQNIQQGSNNKPSKGAYIFADDYDTEVGKADTYSVEVVVIENQVKIGFKTRSADGNWVAVDNFSIKYQGRSADMLMDALKRRYEKMESLTSLYMNVDVLAQLNKSIEDAKALSDVKGMDKIAIALRENGEAAEKSIAAYASLKDMLDKAKGYDASGSGGSEFASSISEAQKQYDDAVLMEKGVEDEVAKLDNAILRYCLANPKGEAPVVTTVKYVARGATGALGRSTVKGSKIKEKGFCWATHPEPTVLDERSTFSYDINGPMYLMQPLKPATVYYVRAYAMTEDYAVGYGEVRKVITLPKGNSSYSYNYGGPAEANERINKALAECIDYYDNWSSTTDFRISCSYGSGTPTADCGYGGGMRVGPNASYQRTGTILHESNHGVGVGTQGRWWDASLHQGEWKGWRANSLLQFIDNNPSAKMQGDDMHMWPYGINGAHEDSGWPMLYIANVMITQALHEDGLIPPNHGGCKPAYVFEQEDDVKYYITNENANNGKGVAFLTENDKGILSWSAPEDGVAGNDAYAWYTSFDPSRQLYRIRNAKSGRYFSYGSNIKTVSKSAPGENEYFHLMVGRKEKVLGSKTTGVKTRSYWIMAGNDVATPLTLAANAKGVVASPSFDISDAASSQRWFILTEGELETIESSNVDLNREKLLKLIDSSKKLVKVEHEDLKENVTADFAAMLDNYKDMAPTMADASELSAAIENIWIGMETFLNNTKLADVSKPYDMTFAVENTAMNDSEVWGATPAVSYNCSEFFNTKFTMKQKLPGMPSGKYIARVQAFQRPGNYKDVYDKYAAGTLKTTARIYIKESKPLKSIMDDAQKTKVGKGVEQKVGEYYIPDNMQAADAYFSKGLYDNEVAFEWEKRADMNVRFFNNTVASSDWTIFRNFRLYHLGGGDAVDTSVDGVDAKADGKHEVFTVQGVKLSNDGQSLQPGLYIIDGKKVLKR